MSKLCSVFEQKVKDLHGFEIIGRSQALKLRLKKNFPQLTFLKPRKKNACEVVMCETTVPDHLLDSDGDTTSTNKETESDEDADSNRNPSTG